ncbi:MAG: response regulator [Thermodesulfobacteriota bacterium]|nr:response regulator [Thermodesulfobacteriota bacterium]
MALNKSITILVAEDDYLVSEEIIRGLRMQGYEKIMEAANGHEAVDKACSHRPDIIFMDIRMPEIDGLEAAQQIQDCCPTPVVILTAYDSQDFLQKAANAGIGAYLTKPPKPKDLERAITIAMARHLDLVELRRLNKELKLALDEVKRLRGILPICANCKKIRDDQGYWQQIETYIREHSEADFSHGICPDCLKKLYPKFNIR